MTHFKGADSGNYFVTMSGSGSPIIFDGCQYVALSTAFGPRFIKTDGTVGVSTLHVYVLNSRITTSEGSASTDDILLGDAAATCFLENTRLDGRHLVVYNNNSSAGRVKVNEGTLSLPYGDYDSPHIALGSSHLWKNATNGRLYLREGNTGGVPEMPANDTDGAVIVVADTPTLITSGTTPSVAGVFVLKSSMAAPTTVTDLPNGRTGQVVTIICTNGNTTINTGGNFRLAGNFVSSTDDTLQLVFDGSLWYEIGRSANA